MPTIDFTQGDVWYETDADKTVTCTQEGGNPLSDLSWDCVSLTGTTQNNNGRSTSSVTVAVNRNINLQQCECTATNPDSGVTYIQVVSRTFTVHCEYISLHNII